ncbi:MAG: EAL domain-containing protein, partial [bacterium]
MEKYNLPQEEKEILERLRQPFAIYQFVDKRVVTLVLSEGFCRLFGYEDYAKAYYDMDNYMYKDVHPDDVARIANTAFRFATEGGGYEVLYRVKKKGSSNYRIIHAYGEHVYTETGVQLAHIWFSDEGDYMEDCGEECLALSQSLSNALHENSIVKASQYDYLTGLPSMTYFFELAETGKMKTREKGRTPVLMYLDFRGMKFYNSKYGFAEGDRLLQAFAKILAEIFGNEHSCRIGSDHFAVQTEKEGLDEKIQQMFLECREMNGRKTLPVHVGIYVSQGERIHTSVACDRAKLACSALSGRYEMAVNYYSAELSEDVERKQYIIENIDRALSENWIQVYLQPIIRAVNVRVCDMEALARWIDPVKGFLSPADFIPALEDAGLIYKLDLYMVDRVLGLIKAQQDAGFEPVPHSINLSRSDFDTCDIVEEIRRRVDEAGIARDKLTIEITESIIGSDFEFMKGEVERFRKLGFPVWMDDFGSGYSSLDVLQSIKFDLIKFDMSFMRRFDEGENGRIILTELMRMATSLGLDTVCEGVETRRQFHFLQEIGCSKLQGYYFSKPLSLEDVWKMQKSNKLFTRENPDESEYYTSISQVSLYDLGASGSEENGLRHTFSTMPIAILEVNKDRAQYVRSNGPYRYFAKRFFNFPIIDEPMDLKGPEFAKLENFVSAVKECAKNGYRVFFEETVMDGSTFHFFARRVHCNPVTQSAAIVIAVLSISEPDETSYADIARALATDYNNIFVIDLDTEDYIEYLSRSGGEELSLERRGEDFFEAAKGLAKERIYEEDRESFLASFTKEKVLQDLDSQGIYTAIYRRIESGTPLYVNLKITRMRGGNRIILGVSVIDSLVKEQAEKKKLRQEKASLERIAALAPNYLVLYTVDPDTGHYVQYNPSNEFARLGLAKEGEDFFRDVKLDAAKAIAPEDVKRHLSVLTKRNMLRVIAKYGSFVHKYRLMLDGKLVPAMLRATLADGHDRKQIILGVTVDDEEYRRQLEEAYKEASSTAAIYTHIAHALARGYTDLYYVNMETEEFIEYHTDDELGVLTEARRSTNFFGHCEKEVMLYVHPEDQKAFIEAMNPEFLANALGKNRVYELTYRKLRGKKPFYVQMKVSRMEDDERLIVIAVSDVDELIRKRRAEERIEEERVIYARLHAISGNFICVYVVDPETGSYREFSSVDDYEKSFAQAKEGADFFASLQAAVAVYSHPSDRTRVISLVTRENVMEEIERSGIFTLGYRIMKDGQPLHVQLKAAMVDEKEGRRLIVGLNDIDMHVRQEEEFARRLAK